MSIMEKQKHRFKQHGSCLTTAKDFTSKKLTLRS